MKFKIPSLKNAASLTKTFSKTGLTILVLLIIVLLSVWVVLKSMTGPAQGTIKPAVTFTNEPKINYILFEGQRAEFSYPETSRIEKNDKLPISVAESYWLAAPSTPKNPAWYIAITIYRLPSLKPEDNSTYKTRQDNPQTYTKSTANIKGKQVTMFKNEDSLEKVAYMRHGDLLAAVALTGASQNPTAVSDFERILVSWNWK